MKIKLESGSDIRAFVETSLADATARHALLPQRNTEVRIAAILDEIKIRVAGLRGGRVCIELPKQDRPELLWQVDQHGVGFGRINGHNGERIDDFAAWLARVEQLLLPFTSAGERAERRIDALERRVSELEAAR